MISCYYLTVVCHHLHTISSFYVTVYLDMTSSNISFTTKDGFCLDLKIRIKVSPLLGKVLLYHTSNLFYFSIILHKLPYNFHFWKYVSNTRDKLLYNNDSGLLFLDEAFREEKGFELNNY
jgi:hypothetical protein